MAKYVMDNGSVVDTKKAIQHWDEDTQWNGNNHISVNTGSQWVHETLYQSSKGRYYIVHESQWQGSLPSADFISDEQATHWLIANNHELPETLEQYEESIVE